MHDLELRQWARVLRGRWRIILPTVVLCAAIAAAYAWTRTPLYEADTQMFISTVGSTNDLSQTYQGGLFAQQRVLSYTGIVSSPPVLQSVINALSLPETVSSLQKKVSATVPQGTVLLDVAVQDNSPRRAQAIAAALDTAFPRFVNTLETSPSSPGRAPAGSSVKVSVVAPPHLPTGAVSPRKPLILALGVLLGVILGIAAALLREYWDRRIRDFEDAAAIAGASLIGSIPEDSKAGKRPLVVLEDPHSIVAEGYRQLRTNLQYRSHEHAQQTFVVCSAVPSEGKTVIAANLSLAMAQAGLRVILVDADMRLPRVAELFGMDNGRGLSDALTGSVPLDDLLQAHDTLPLKVMASGPSPTNPSEILEEFPLVLAELMSRADFVIVDSPAVLPVTDASILAQAAAGVILVARVASTRTKQLQAAAQSLRLVEAEIVGVVANFVSRHDAYGGGYGRYNYAPSRPLQPAQPADE